MSLNVGTLTRKEDKDNGTYFEGYLTLEQCHGRVWLVPNTKRQPNSPDFKLKRRLPDGRTMETGSAWLGKMKGDKGEEYVSVTIQAPGQQVPVYIKAFPADEQPEGAAEGHTVFNAIWNPSRPGGFVGRGSATKGLEGDAVPFG